MQLKRGFTLVELMVTIAVIAILATIAAPSMNNLIVSYQLNQSADQFLWGLKEGRSRAAALRNKVIICPDKKSLQPSVPGTPIVQQSITSTDCLNAAGITDNAAVSKYIDECRVILTPSSSKIQISPNMGSVANVIYTQTGNSTANTTKFCSNGKALAITVDKLGTVNKEKKDTCV